jgi:multiple sugar transport system ATP-binding protein
MRLANGSEGYEATIEVIEPTGPNIQVYSTLAGQSICSIFNERQDFRPGEQIKLVFSPKNIHIFDERSGKRL